MRRSRVLFVCIGNSCRSQMAEGFARAYGSDVLAASSAGLSPCGAVSPVTQAVMLEKNIDLSGCVSKGIDEAELARFDLVVNMSGWDFFHPDSVPVRDWKVDDPIGLSYERHCQVRDQIEGLVQSLIVEFRDLTARRNS